MFKILHNFAKHFQSENFVQKYEKKTDMQNRKKIVLEHGVAQRLRDELGVTYPTIRTALSYQSNTPKARMIRQRALQLGGEVMQSTL